MKVSTQKWVRFPRRRVQNMDLGDSFSSGYREEGKKERVREVAKQEPGLSWSLASGKPGA